MLEQERFLVLQILSKKLIIVSYIVLLYQLYYRISENSKMSQPRTIIQVKDTKMDIPNKVLGLSSILLENIQVQKQIILQDTKLAVWYTILDYMKTFTIHPLPKIDDFCIFENTKMVEDWRVEWIQKIYRDKREDFLIEVFNISVELDIPSLINICSIFFAFSLKNKK